MANGQQLAEQYFQVFSAWIASKTDDDFRAIAFRGVLSRTEIIKECGFSKSVLDQNKRVKASLGKLEDGLRKRGVLPPAVEPATAAAATILMREPGRLRGAQEADRLRRLEQENASLKAELAEVKRVLAKYVVLRDALALTGRLPR